MRRRHSHENPLRSHLLSRVDARAQICNLVVDSEVESSWQANESTLSFQEMINESIRDIQLPHEGLGDYMDEGLYLGPEITDYEDY